MLLHNIIGINQITHSFILRFKFFSMKLVSYLNDGQDQLAILVDGMLYNTDELHPDLPGSMSMFLNYWDDAYPNTLAAERAIKEKRFQQNRGIPYNEVEILTPVPFPPSLRDGFAFKQHAENTSKNRVPAFNEYPVFFFANHHSVKGPGEIKCMPDHLQQLDFELEAAIVICRHGKNIKAEYADNYIAGIMVMNDLSARQLQREEMMMHLGPAKGKDFATATGPALVTLDELEAYEIPANVNHFGKSWNMEMTCQVNGKKVTKGNLGSMDWTFAEIIERASYGVDLYPGDIIGSGTVGNGCFLELNNSAKLSDAGYTEQWLQEDDVVELEIRGLGILRNTIVKEDTDWSILNLKKI